MLPRAREEVIRVEGSHLPMVPAADVTGQEGQPPVQNTLTLGSETIPADSGSLPALKDLNSICHPGAREGSWESDRLGCWSLTGWVSTNPTISGHTLSSLRLSILVC